MTDPNGEPLTTSRPVRHAGTPLRSDGKLTILSLAQEAGIKRWHVLPQQQHVQTGGRTNRITVYEDTGVVRLGEY